jgi:hypothetical protein
MDEVRQRIQERAHEVRLRSRRIAETLPLLERLLAAPTWQDVIQLHELHARHEHEAGRPASAARALDRARAAARRAAEGEFQPPT